MSICLTWFPIGGLGEPYLYQNLGDFTRTGDFTWRVSDYEELVGVTHRRPVVGFRVLFFVEHSPEKY